MRGLFSLPASISTNHQSPVQTQLPSNTVSHLKRIPYKFAKSCTYLARRPAFFSFFLCMCCIVCNPVSHPT
ncbi:hypothetical protein L873DRAFT_162506 [Choiromyces venosus 120613-1]|uniref:Uncharacterized protein n=1 Tax=Choiromyces venosus 120613-1 TaxID=1336337 RepID=A0A3N4JZG9_9PEZI|nr:hypothetical protein L873DRAFT_162506 [Choiromyces venosus 120613-1]